ncbi:DMT family transporter [Aureibacillus halotolerans]|uniref:Threonine/homoserine efflux transporter RhtA n=1 Tax=Aureibacillus halotolerans TaxID=1508390 RepID=A0A4R6U699_9BACI|nr:DMT family transporter [Aureibacillus halotolerans]TDQ42028.1 threonine/homoserine efflux transporter RhtA [Aureibacillus halotolerans]
MKASWHVYIIVLAATLFWGFNVPVLKIVVSSFAPLPINALRIFVAGLMLLALCFFSGQLRRLKKSEVLSIVGAGVVGIMGHHFFLALGLASTTGMNSGLILGLVPLATALSAALLLRQTFNFIRIFGVLLGFFGVTAVILFGNGHFTGLVQGDIYILFAVFAQAVGFIFVFKASKTVAPLLLTAYSILIGSLALLLIAFVTEPSGFATMTTGTPVEWACFFLSSIFATALGQYMYNQAIPKLGAAETAIFTNFTPFFALIGSWLILDEAVSWRHWIGFVAIVIGVFLGSGAYEQWRKTKRSKGMDKRVAS